MDQGINRPEAAAPAAKEAWIKPEIGSLNAGEALIPKDIDPEGGGASFIGP